MSDALSRTKPTRLRLRFTLRLLLAVVTLLCAGLAVWTHRAREQRRVVEWIKSTGGEVYYDYQRPWNHRHAPAIESRVPSWLLHSLGVDYFHEVTEAEVFDPEILPELNRFRRLRSLTIANRSLTDKSFAPVGRLRGLIALSVYPNSFAPTLTEVGDETLTRIAQLPNLELANVLGSRITLRGLETLAHSASLHRLQIVSNDGSVDEDAAEPFRRVGRADVLIQRWWNDAGKTSQVVSKYDAN